MFFAHFRCALIDIFALIVTGHQWAAVYYPVWLCHNKQASEAVPTLKTTFIAVMCVCVCNCICRHNCILPHNNNALKPCRVAHQPLLHIFAHSWHALLAKTTAKQRIFTCLFVYIHTLRFITFVFLNKNNKKYNNFFKVFVVRQTLFSAYLWYLTAAEHLWKIKD